MNLGVLKGIEMLNVTSGISGNHRSGTKNAIPALMRSLASFAFLGSMALGAVAQVENVVIPNKPAGEHWLWINDLQFGGYNREVLYNVENGYILGAIDTGWEGIKLEFPKNSNEIYSAQAYMDRGYRGKRTDVVSIYDKHTLMPIREFGIPDKTVKGWPDPTLTALSDDNRFMYIEFMTPAASVGVADMKNDKFASEIETTGCSHVMSAGNRRFFSLCGDGSLLSVNVDDTGQEVSRKRYPGFFDIDKDPVHGSGTRDGNIWYFVSHRGQIHSVDVSGEDLKILPQWQVSVKQGDKTWVPGAWMQSVAVNGPLNRLYVSMHLHDLKSKSSGYDFHALSGTELWAFDLNTKKIVQKIKLKAPATHIAVSQDASPYIYVSAMWNLKVDVYGYKKGNYIKSIPVPSMPTLLQPVNDNY